MDISAILYPAAMIAGVVAVIFLCKFFNKRVAQRQDMRKAQQVATQEANHANLRSIGYMK